MGGVQELHEPRVDGGSDREHSESMPVVEGEGRVVRRELLPEPPDPELGLPHVRVVQQHDAVVAELRQPRREIVGHVLVAMGAVDVEQVDRSVAERSHRLVERLLPELRERSVQRVVVAAELLEHFRPVRSGVDVTRPRVDGVAASRKLERGDCLAESAVGVALPGPELDDRRGPERGDGEERKRHVAHASSRRR